MEPDDLVPAREVAVWLGCHERQVRKLAELGVIQRDGNGRYRLQETVRTAHVHVREAAAGRGPGDSAGPDLAIERALLARAQRVAQERSNAVKAGRLFEEDVIVNSVGSLLIVVRSRLLALPTMAAPLLLGLPTLGAVTNVLSRLVHDALEELASGDAVVARLKGAVNVGAEGSPAP